MQRRFIVIGLILILLALGMGTGWLLMRGTTALLPVAPTPEPLALAHFADHKDESPDASHSSRLVRGVLSGVSPSDDKMTMQAWVAFPNQEITREILLNSNERTQYLCWKPMQNGVLLEQASILLTDMEKLFQPGEQYISRQKVIELLHDKNRVSILVALTQPYRVNATNIPYQVVLLGCDD